jgi:hypothetical protein
MTSHAKRVARLEQAAGVNLRLPAKKRRLVELIATATLRKAGDLTPRSFAHVTDAELYRIIGTTPEGFDAAMRDFVNSPALDALRLKPLRAEHAAAQTILNSTLSTP